MSPQPENGLWRHRQCFGTEHSAEIRYLANILYFCRMMSPRKTKICILTSTRADWGLLMPVAGSLAAREDVELQIVASNMHLIPELGMTVNEIKDAGFTVDRCVDCRAEGDDDFSRAVSMSRSLEGTAEALRDLRPDAVIILGDRYEMLAAAAAAATMHVPVIHIAGGEISEGALDDSFRHAITKLSTLHLTATEPYRRRVIQMGEEPERVVNTGAIGVWNAFNTPLLSAEALGAELGVDFDRPVIAVTFHPATNETSAPPEAQVDALLAALDRFPELMAVITAPNNDAGGGSILARLTEYCALHPDRTRLVRSLGMVRYQSLLRYVKAVVGNSSSGIVEAPSAGVPTVDIGIRQRGRIAAPSVLHCDADADAIEACLRKTLSPEMQRLAAKKENPYYKPDTLALMTDAIMAFADTLPAPAKHFHDIEQ